jgi:hypothetical protein
MIHETHIAPPNSVILVMDQTVGEVPDSMNKGIVSATRSCIAIGTLSEVDGETFISLSDETPAQLPKAAPVFDGTLFTPTKKLSVCSVLGDSLLVLDVPSSSTRVRIWVNHPVEPSAVWIVVGDKPT